MTERLDTTGDARERYEAAWRVAWREYTEAEAVARKEYLAAVEVAPKEPETPADVIQSGWAWRNFADAEAAARRAHEQSLAIARQYFQTDLERGLTLKTNKELQNE